jgi:hypothetical protein
MSGLIDRAESQPAKRRTSSKAPAQGGPEGTHTAAPAVVVLDPNTPGGPPLRALVVHRVAAVIAVGLLVWAGTTLIIDA